MILDKCTDPIPRPVRDYLGLCEEEGMTIQTGYLGNVIDCFTADSAADGD